MLDRKNPNKLVFKYSQECSRFLDYRSNRESQDPPEKKHIGSQNLVMLAILEM
jgi:hypothetical protein